MHQAREIEEGVSAKLGEGAMFFAQFIGGIFVGFYYSWDVALVACATAPPCTVGLYFLTKITSETATKLTAAYSKAGGVALETIYNMRTVASLQCEDSKSRKARKALFEWMKLVVSILCALYNTDVFNMNVEFYMNLG